MTYQIHLEGKLEPGRWYGFEGLSVSYRDGATVLTGSLPDQPALHGLLKRIRDLGLTIIKVERLGPL